MRETIRSAHLYYRDGRSDKQYQIYLYREHSDYYVLGANGRRGASLQLQPKADGDPLTLGEANKVFDAVLAEKYRKRYVDGPPPPASIAPMPPAQPASPPPARRLVSVPAPVDREFVDRRASDEDWIAQPLIEGRVLRVTVAGGGASAADEEGDAVPLEPAVATDAVALAEGGPLVLEGVLLLGRFFATDMLASEDGTLRDAPYWDRLLALQERIFRRAFFDGAEPANITIVPTAETTEDKRSLIERVSIEAGEIVFRRRSAPYREGEHPEVACRWDPAGVGATR